MIMILLSWAVLRPGLVRLGKSIGYAGTAYHEACSTPSTMLGKACDSAGRTIGTQARECAQCEGVPVLLYR